MSHPSRILVVDDEPLNLQVFEYNFAEEFPLLYASGAEEALALLEAHPVAVIIADHRMPGMLGLDLLALVARRFPAVVRMLLTAHTDVPLLLDAVNRGDLFRYVPKPWEPDAMRQDMQLALSRHGEEIQRQRLLRHAAEHVHTTGALTASLANSLGEVDALLTEAAKGGEGAATAALVRAALRVRTLHEGALRESRRQAKPQRESVTELVSEAVNAVGLWNAESGVALELIDEASAAQVMVPAMRLVEAVTALLRNATEAASAGPAPRSVQVRVVRAASDRVRIVVSDSGGGFSPEGRPELFGSTRGRAGFGLAIAGALANGAGGQLDLSGAQSGRVALTLPLAPPGR